MIGRELIDPMVPLLKPEDSVLKALDLMEEFKLSSLPVVDDAKFLGVVSEEVLLKSIDDDSLVSSFQLEKGAQVLQDTHILDVLKHMIVSRGPIAVVLDSSKQFIGAVTFADILKYFSGISSFRSPGGILVILMNNHDYSLSEISRIVEVNGAKILSSYIQNHDGDPNKLMVTLKLNIEGLSRVIAAIERYEYKILASFHKDDLDNNEKERLDMLFRYLDI